MKLPPLTEGTLVRRYKRFLADVTLADGSTITAHTANPGAMKGLLHPGGAVWLSHHPDKGRKLPYSWELARVRGRLVGVNPIRSNDVVADALSRGRVPAFASTRGFAREKRFGTRGSRVDFVVEGDAPCFLEVKTATLMEGRTALFPDGATERGRKHLEELIDQVRQGARAAVLFVVQRADVDRVMPADAIDPAYGDLLRAAEKAGVELLAHRCRVTRRFVTLGQAVPVVTSRSSPGGSRSGRAKR